MWTLPRTSVTTSIRAMSDVPQRWRSSDSVDDDSRAASVSTRVDTPRSFLVVRRQLVASNHGVIKPVVPKPFMAFDSGV